MSSCRYRYMYVVCVVVCACMCSVWCVCLHVYVNVHVYVYVYAYVVYFNAVFVYYTNTYDCIRTILWHIHIRIRTISKTKKTGHQLHTSQTLGNKGTFPREKTGKRTASRTKRFPPLMPWCFYTGSRRHGPHTAGLWRPLSSQSCL